MIDLWTILEANWNWALVLILLVAVGVVVRFAASDL